LTGISLLLLTMQWFFLAKLYLPFSATEHSLLNEAVQKKLTPNACCADKFVPRNYTEPHRITSLTTDGGSHTYRCVLSSDINRKKKKTNTYTIKGIMHISRRAHTHTHTAGKEPSP